MPAPQSGVATPPQDYSLPHAPQPQVTGEKALSNELASFRLSNSSPIWFSNLRKTYVTKI